MDKKRKRIYFLDNDMDLIDEIMEWFEEQEDVHYDYYIDSIKDYSPLRVKTLNPDIFILDGFKHKEEKLEVIYQLKTLNQFEDSTMILLMENSKEFLEIKKFIYTGVDYVFINGNPVKEFCDGISESLGLEEEEGFLEIMPSDEKYTIKTMDRILSMTENEIQISTNLESLANIDEEGLNYHFNIFDSFKHLKLIAKAIEDETIDSYYKKRILLKIRYPDVMHLPKERRKKYLKESDISDWINTHEHNKIKNIKTLVINRDLSILDNIDSLPFIKRIDSNLDKNMDMITKYRPEFIAYEVLDGSKLSKSVAWKLIQIIKETPNYEPFIVFFSVDKMFSLDYTKLLFFKESITAELLLKMLNMLYDAKMEEDEKFMFKHHDKDSFVDITASIQITNLSETKLVFRSRFSLSEKANLMIDDPFFNFVKVVSKVELKENLYEYHGIFHGVSQEQIMERRAFLNKAFFIKDPLK